MDIKISIAQLRTWLTWLLGCLSIVVGGLLIQEYFHNGFVVETDLQALFPIDEDNQLSQHINDRLFKEYGNKLIIATYADSIEKAQAAADIVAKAVADNSLLKQETSESNADLAAQQIELLNSHRFHLLTDNQTRDIEQSNFSNILQNARNSLMGFSGNGLSPLQDPLALANGIAQQLQPPLAGELINNRLVIKDEKNSLILFALNLNGQSFNLTVQEKINDWLTQLRNQIKNNNSTQDAQILVSGAVFHAAESSANAKREMTIIGAGSTIGIILLYLLAFKRLQPLMLSICSLMYGFLFAVAFCYLMFDKLHLMTLVFGSSLIGVADDYSVHYLCKHQHVFLGIDKTKSNLPYRKKLTEKIISTLLLGLFLALVTSVLGYGCLLQPALPGLHQIAYFSIFGLIGSWLFVIVIYPYFFRTPFAQPSSIIDFISSLPWRTWGNKIGTHWFWVFIPSLLLVIAGTYRLEISSDVRMLYKPSAELLNSEKKLHQLLQSFSPNQYFVLRAPTPEALLSLEEKFRHTQLDQLVNEGALRGYSATSQIVPSIATQTHYYQLLSEKVYRENGIASEFMQNIGLDKDAINSLQQQFTQEEKHFLTVENWLPVTRPDQALLWLGKINDDYVSVIALRGVKDVKALSASVENSDNIRWVDRVNELSMLLKKLLHSAATMLALAYALTFIFMWFAYRKARALVLVLVPLSATAITLSLISVCNVPINLFHIFGCFLVLGLGMDYSIFAYESNKQDAVSQRAIGISALTTALSFGLLSASSTPMVQAFGVTLLSGTFMSLLLAPLMARLKKNEMMS